MTLPVLATYATRAGSTAEVAHTVADVLRERGLQVDLQPVTNVHSVEAYSAVAVGAPLYMGRLHREVRAFLSAHRTELTQMPVALFVLGPVQHEEKDWKGARAQLDNEMRRMPWLKPISIQLLGGKFDPAKLRFPFSIFLRGMQPRDIRDWSAIRTMAGNFAASFEPSLH
jgi:menaquinone-dependent protoporphyrinogen oxidase